MRSVVVTGPGSAEVIEVPTPSAGPNDVLLRMRASGICGTDHMYIGLGGVGPHKGCMPLGHEPAAEVVEVGAEVSGIEVGDHVVINPMALDDGVLGNGGASGALAEYVLIRDAAPDVQVRIIPKEIPWEVAALNEPMAVSRHAVNRLDVRAGAKVAIVGAGPIGLGALLAAKAKGAGHVVVIDIQPARLKTALEIGADAVINSSTEDVRERLIALHGEGPAGVGHAAVKPDTDGYLDAAGAPAALHTILSCLKERAVVTIPAVYKEEVSIDFRTLLATEVDIRMAMAYPTEIFEVTDDIIANADKYRKIISHVMPYSKVMEAIELAGTPGAADKVVVLFDN